MNAAALRTAVLLAAASLMTGCSAGIFGSLQTEDPRFGSTDSLNYEYTNRSTAEEVRTEHYLLNIEIEEPYILTTGNCRFLPVHAAVPITGSAIVRIFADAGGHVQKYEFVKRAGLELDSCVEEMMKGVTVKPLRTRGTGCPSVFLARFSFTGESLP